MRGEEFLSLVAQRQLAPVQMIVAVRNQVVAAPRVVSAEAVAKVFVDAGHLTAFQARQLIAGDAIDTRPSPEASRTVKLPEMEEELSLCSLEEKPAWDGSPIQVDERLAALDDSDEGLIAEQPEEFSPAIAPAWNSNRQLVLGFWLTLVGLLAIMLLGVTCSLVNR